MCLSFARRNRYVAASSIWQIVYAQSHPLARCETNRMTIHPARLPDDVLLDETRLERLRRGGPGGQRRNKVSTGVKLVHQPTGIEATATERRSGRENQATALRRLRIALAIQIRSPSLKGSPTSLWQERTQNEKLVLSGRHKDFPAILAEALDHLHASGGDFARAASKLQITRSQLMKLISQTGAALEMVNRWRTEKGLRKLKKR